MRISVEWLNELINLKTLNFDYLVEKLTLGGFEVEESFELIIDNKKDTIIDVTSTANRSDSLSLKGIGKEVAALFDKPYNISKYTSDFFEVEKLIKKSLAKVNVCDKKKKNCSVFLTIEIENLTNLNSPKWLQQKLRRAGIEPFNNLLDLQNYIFLETGYPFEFYDLDKIISILNDRDFTLSLKSENFSKPFQGANNSEYYLNSDILVIKANDEILSIAGILVNKNFQYMNDTKSLLIEGSIFNSKQIRQTSRILGLRTDRSSRYEKGVNSSYLIESLCRLLYLLKISNNKISIKINTATHYKEIEQPIISLKYNTIIEVLGPIIYLKKNEISKLQSIDISNYLNRLNFTYTFDQHNLIWFVKIPIERYDDITREIDLIEEIGRLHGFNNFITVLPEISKVGVEDFSYQIRKKITSCFLSEGFNEVMHYSLVNEPNKSSVQIFNPLSQDSSILRSTLLPNLIQTISENLNQTGSNLEAFEYGHVFFGSKNSAPIEIEQVGGIFGAVKTKLEWANTSNILSWFEAKGKLENVFNKLNLFIYWRIGLPKIYKNILHPYRTGKLYSAPGLAVGVFGQINPILADQLNISSQLYLFEFNLELLKDDFKYKKLPFYKNYSLYPKIVKDLSFIISQNITFEKIKTTIFLIGPKFLTSIELLDEYRGKSIPKTMTSLCIQLTFQSNEKTLINKEIETIIEMIQIILIEEFKIIIRL
jgi:phenylalanyl-tRNA synthetase beta chain